MQKILSDSVIYQNVNLLVLEGDTPVLVHVPTKCLLGLVENLQERTFGPPAL